MSNKQNDGFVFCGSDLSAVVAWDKTGFSKPMAAKFSEEWYKESPEKFLVFSLPSVMDFVQKMHISYKELNVLYIEDRAKFFDLLTGSTMHLMKDGYLKYDSFLKWHNSQVDTQGKQNLLDGSLMHLIKDLKLLKYKQIANLCEKVKDPVLVKLALSPDTLFLVKEGYFSFDKVCEWALLGDSLKFVSILNLDVSYWIRVEKLVDYVNFEKIYDKFLKHFEPVIWQYVLNSVTACKMNFEEIVEQYKDDLCSFQEYVMSKELQNVISAAREKIKHGTQCGWEMNASEQKDIELTSENSDETDNTEYYDIYGKNDL